MAIRRALSKEDGNLDSVTFATTANRQNLDIDLAFGARPTTGDVFKKREAEAVKQSVRNLLTTGKFEKPFQPNYGAGLYEFLFELDTVYDGEAIVNNVKEAIRVYEPRVDHKTLEVIPRILTDHNSLQIDVIFRVINSGETVELTTTLNRLR